MVANVPMTEIKERHVPVADLKCEHHDYFIIITNCEDNFKK